MAMELRRDTNNLILFCACARHLQTVRPRHLSAILPRAMTIL